MVYAGALIAEVTRYNAPLDWFLKKAWQDTLMAAPFATIGTAIWIFVAYKFNQSIVDMVTGAREVTRQEEPRLYTLLENLSISRGIPPPKSKIMETGAPNASASALTPQQYSATCTTGLINPLDA